MKRATFGWLIALRYPSESPIQVGLTAGMSRRFLGLFPTWPDKCFVQCLDASTCLSWHDWTMGMKPTGIASARSPMDTYFHTGSLRVFRQDCFSFNWGGPFFLMILQRVSGGKEEVDDLL